MGKLCRMVIEECGLKVRRVGNGLRKGEEKSASGLVVVVIVKVVVVVSAEAAVVVSFEYHVQ